MNKLILDIDKDIQRCEEVLIENNYLEIVIAVEELTDKYKNEIPEISATNNKVWSYTKNDLLIIKDILNSNMSNILKEHNKQRTIDIFKNIRENTLNDEALSKEKIDEIINLINKIEEINNKNIDREQKWNELKKFVSYTTNESIDVSKNIISLICTVIQSI